MRLFFLGTMYQGNLDLLRVKSELISETSYDEHLDELIENTTEFIGSYVRTFRRLGHTVGCTVANYRELQLKWRREAKKHKLSDKQILTEQVKEFAPEILWLDDISVIDPEWLNNIRKSVKSLRIILYYHCSPLKPGMINQLKLVDLVLACTPGLNNVARDIGLKSYLVYHGFDIDFLDRLSTMKAAIANRLLFTGSLMMGPGYHLSRIKLIERLAESDMDLSLYANLENPYKIHARNAIYYLNKIGFGNLHKFFPFLNYGNTEVFNYSKALRRINHDPVFGYEMLNLLKNSRTVLNYHGEISNNYAGNMRLFEVTGVGSCLLTDNKTNIPELFVPGKEIVVYDNADDCIEKARWLMNNDQERAKIAAAGQNKTLKSHTVGERCKSIIEIINSELSPKS